MGYRSSDLPVASIPQKSADVIWVTQQCVTCRKHVLGGAAEPSEWSETAVAGVVSAGGQKERASIRRPEFPERLT